MQTAKDGGHVCGRGEGGEKWDSSRKLLRWDGDDLEKLAEQYIESFNCERSQLFEKIVSQYL